MTFEGRAAVPNWSTWVLLLALVAPGCGGIESQIRKADDVYRGGDVNAALAEYQQIEADAELEGVELDANFYKSMARAYEDLGEHQKAINTYRRAISAGGADAQVYEKMGEIQVKIGDFRGAAASYNSALQLVPGNQAYLDALRRSLEAEDLYSEYVAAVRELVAKTPEDAHILVELGDRYREEKVLDAAGDAYVAALFLDPAPLEVWRHLAIVRSETHQYIEAAPAWEEVTRREPDLKSWKALATARLALRQYDAARDAWIQAAKLAPIDPEVIAGLALAMHYSGQSVEALKRLEKATTNQPRATDLWLAMARIQIDRTQWKGATRALEVVRSLEPDNPEGVLLMGYAYLQQGQPARAEPLLVQARDARPDDPEVNGYLCALYERMGRYGDALDPCTAAVAGDPTHFDAVHSLGRVQLAQGQYVEGMETLKGLQRSHSDNVLLMVEVARLDIATGQLEEALILARKAVEKSPRTPEPATVLAQVQMARGEQADAARILRGALERYPRNPGVRATLASLEARRGNPAEARRLLAELKGPDLQLPLVVMAQADMLFADGRQEEALTLLKQATSTTPGELILVADLARLYGLAGQPEGDAITVKLRSVVR